MRHLPRNVDKCAATTATLALSLVLLLAHGPVLAKTLAKTSVSGRVFSRLVVSASGGNGDREEATLSVASARMRVRHSWRHVSAVVEAELTGKPDLRDGYVRFSYGSLGGRAGQFKEPLSAIESLSAWTLPQARRGLLHDLITRRLLVGGRRPGVELAWKGVGTLEPVAKLGVFQAVDTRGRPMSGTPVGEEGVALRLQVGPKGMRAGMFGEVRAVAPTARGIEHFFAGGFDLAVAYSWPGHAVRAWLDAHVGNSWLDFEPTDERHARFVSGRAIVAWRLGGIRKGTPYFEVHAQLGVFDPDTAIRSDVAWEATLGTSVGSWDRARLGLEGSVTRAMRHAPPSLGGPEASLADSVSLVVQAGVAF
ncbi:MAG: hypothetical protein HY698_13645 [Deltaproteobacteria bacterium]|nr:hypothetical protein [Deltaproteobacteria bacterium]